MDAIREAIQQFILNLFGGWFLAEEFCVLICSMLPIIELRGAIPMAAAFNMPWWSAFILSVIGNMLPVPIILLFIKKFITSCLYYRHCRYFSLCINSFKTIKFI